MVQGRNVDISEVEEYYRKNNWGLNEPARAFFREFYNITSSFNFKYKNKTTGKWSIGSNELWFDTSTSNDIFPTEDDDIEDFNCERALVAEHEPLGFVPVANCGFHLGGTLWVGASGKFYRTCYFATDKIECHQSVMEIFKYDFGQYRNDDELFVSFDGYAKEWGVGGDAYMKKYLDLYGESNL